LFLALASWRLLEGSFLNDRHVMDEANSCYEVLRNSSLFVRGAIWGSASVGWGIVYYRFVSKIKNKNQTGNPVNGDNHGSIPMTQSQVPV
ncbi:hypothetical protein MKW94_019222, partial [Papaver nudicaule]|nr:hypothetical protein [Papaver nudicaule]